MISCRYEIHRHSRCGPYVCLGSVACDDEAEMAASLHGTQGTDGLGYVACDDEAEMAASSHGTRGTDGSGACCA